MNRLSARRPGQTITEYALILGLIAILSIGALVLAGDKVTSLFSSTDSSLNSGPGGVVPSSPPSGPGAFTIVTPDPTIDYPTEFDGPDGASGFEWDFGDGGSSTDENPTHTYTVPGTYTVTLESSAGSWSEEIEVVVASTLTADWRTNPEPPVDPFPSSTVDDANAHYILSGETIEFEDLHTGTASERTWEISEDGLSWTAFSSEANPTYLFTTPGSYKVRLDLNGQLNDPAVMTSQDVGYANWLIEVTNPLDFAIMKQNFDSLEDELVFYKEDDALTSATQVYFELDSTPEYLGLDDLECTWTMQTDVSEWSDGTYNATSDNNTILGWQLPWWDDPDAPGVAAPGSYNISVSCEDVWAGSKTVSETYTLLTGWAPGTEPTPTPTPSPTPTPAPAAIPFTTPFDTFGRTVAGSWGGTWTTGAGVYSVDGDDALLRHTINGNFATASTPFTAAASDTVYFGFDLKVPSTFSNFGLIRANFTNTANGDLELFKSGTANWQLRVRQVNQAAAALVAVPLADNTLYHVRAKVEGNQIAAKIWKDGDAEPGTWSVTSSGSLTGARPAYSTFTLTHNRTVDVRFDDVYLDAVAP